MLKLKLFKFKMKEFFSLYILVFLTTLCSGQSGLTVFLPEKDELPGWVISGDVLEYEKEDLISMLDGGAALYHEYGFKEVMTVNFSNNEGKAINLHVYRMKYSFASYALYLQKSVGSEKMKEIGNDGFVSDYSLGFWKHHYFAIVNSNQAGIEISKGMEDIARIVESRIKNSGKWPDIISKVDNDVGKVTLIRGKISLSNVYFFSTKDVFRAQEGVAYEKDDLIEIILKYSSNYESIQRLGEVAGVLSRERRFNQFRMTGDYSFEMYDLQGNNIEIEAEGRYLLIDIEKNITTVMD